MKKFLVFLVSLVMIVCVSLVTYYFVRNNEIITIKTKEIYCNAGDSIPLKSLGIKIKNANISKKTKFNYNAGGEDVTKFIRYDEELNSFIVSQENAGEVVLKISCTNKKYADFTINVHIGNGSAANPYYIFNETDLGKIGSIYRLDKNYILMNDIALSSAFQPIGYNDIASSWSGFSGSFDGQNHEISGMTLSNLEIDNAGFFSSINASGSVKNLVLKNSTISGEYANAGVLAGVASGNVDKVVVKDASISNSAANSCNGGLVGTHNTKQIIMSYAENVEISAGVDAETKLEGVIAGGLVGKSNQGTIQVCYANNVDIKAVNANMVVGGLVGEFIVATEAGSIQQSYANTTCGEENYGAFVGTISTTSNFDKEKANILRFLIGNMAVVQDKNDQSEIVDGDVINSYDKTFFKNMTYEGRAAFYEKDSAMYLVRGFAGAGAMIDSNEYIFYGIDANNLVHWDTTYVWDVNDNSLPVLKMGSIYPTAPTSEYFRRDLLQKELNSKKAFLEIFKSNIKDQNIKFLCDLNLTDGWNPISVTNTTIDGNNKTITINLANAVSGNMGLFSVVENSTIKNLKIVVKGVSSDATNAGALAGIVKSDGMTTSSIENVKVTFEGFGAQSITNFGGIAGKIQNTVITGCSVANKMSSDSSVQYAGGVVGVNEGTIKNTSVSGYVYGTNAVGGVAGKSTSTITNVSGTITVYCNGDSSDAHIGGIVGSNSGVVNSSNFSPEIRVSRTGSNSYIGGVVGHNSGTIKGVNISGSSISTFNTTSDLYVGGVAGSNSGTIENVNNKITNVGSYNVGNNQYVGGVAAVNSGTIRKVLTQSNLNGNFVGGVVASMNKSGAVIDQVAVGKYNSTGKQLGENKITGDKYIAGIVVDFRAGTIKNIQCSSNISGQTNSTRSSLVALIFPYGATIKCATINSSLTGYGTKYRETWTDFASYSNKGEFGLANGETGDERFNIYKYDTYHGIMQSVVINSSKSGVGGAKASMGAAFAWGKDYQDTADSSFVKTVNGFSDVSQFQGSFTFVCAISTVLGIKHEATKSLQFEIGSYWESNNGISLIFLKNM